MLSKFAWLVTYDSSSLVASLLKNKCGTFLEPKARQGSSCYVFERDLNNRCKDTFAQFCCRQTANSSFTSVWHDPWILGNENFRPMPNSSYLVLSSIQCLEGGEIQLFMGE